MSTTFDLRKGCGRRSHERNSVQRSQLDGNRRIVTLAEDKINARVVVDASGVDSSMARQAGTGTDAPS